MGGGVVGWGFIKGGGVVGLRAPLGELVLGDVGSRVTSRREAGGELEEKGETGPLSRDS